MRAKQLLFFLMLFLLSGCTTVEVAKEITKATTSIKTSITNMTKNQDAAELSEDTIKVQKKSIEFEKEKEREITKNQQNSIKVDFLGKNLDEIKAKLGEPKLLRIDGKIQLARFDELDCRLFLYFDLSKSSKNVEYFEIRNAQGLLINEEEKIDLCYKKFQQI